MDPKVVGGGDVVVIVGGIGLMQNRQITNSREERLSRYIPSERRSRLMAADRQVCHLLIQQIIVVSVPRVGRVPIVS